MRALQATGISIGISLGLTAAMSFAFHQTIRPDFMATGLVCALACDIAIRRVTRRYKAALKRANAKLEEANQELEARVAQRTAELEQTTRQLHVADRLATAGSLAAGVCHEIRNPLAAVLGNLEYLDNGGEERDEAVEEALTGARQMAVVVRDLATLATPHHKTDSTADLSEVASSARRIAAHAFRERGTVDISVDGLRVPGSSQRWVQVLSNLLLNAAHATRADAPNHVAIVGVECSGRVRIEVTDTGCGMDDATLARIFDAGFTTRPDNGGTGLGLRILHDIVSGLDGTVEVESTPGVGTRFVLEVPSVPSSEQSMEAVVAAR